MLTRQPSQPAIAFLATYVPRRCGIATFTRDLRDGIGVSLDLRGEHRAPPVVALDNGLDSLTYPNEVIRVVPEGDLASYRSAARLLDRAGVSAVSVQHEYGIYGGSDGDHLLAFLDELQAPVVSTLHTVLQRPSPHQREVLRAVAARSSRVVVMAERGRALLESVYGLPGDDIAVAPHGVPDVGYGESAAAKAQLGLDGRPLVFSFGLLNPNKRAELVIEAIAGVVDQVPDVRYVVLGATHPAVRREFGERYREDLQALIDRLGLAGNVQLENRYVDQAELVTWLRASDIFVTAHGNAEQVTSGTLAYALAAGKAIISTPYEHAVELLDQGRGILVPFEDSGALSAALGRLLADDGERDRLGRAAYAHGRAMTWPRIGARYVALLAAAAREAQAAEQWTRPWVPVFVVPDLAPASSAHGPAGVAVQAQTHGPLVPPAVHRRPDGIAGGPSSMRSRATTQTTPAYAEVGGRESE